MNVARTKEQVTREAVNVAVGLRLPEPWVNIHDEICERHNAQGGPARINIEKRYY